MVASSPRRRTSKRSGKAPEARNASRPNADQSKSEEPESESAPEEDESNASLSEHTAEETGREPEEGKPSELTNAGEKEPKPEPPPGEGEAHKKSSTGATEDGNSSIA